jgi:hypothetical protein
MEGSSWIASRVGAWEVGLGANGVAGEKLLSPEMGKRYAI